MISLVVSLFLSFSCADVVDSVIATVNGQPILASDVRLLESKIKNKKTLFLEESLLPEDDIQLKKHENLVNYLVHVQILKSEAERLNLSISDQALDKEIREIARRNGLSARELLLSVEREGYT
ncbi:MAG: SurA N-terminal domain-containing protein, partial [Bdellovibrionaceae bacterium]|nr:SurA N-terminal domain-containing protein [Pseudobdellovibrionaceae bacterium]